MQAHKAGAYVILIEWQSFQLLLYWIGGLGGCFFCTVSRVRSVAWSFSTREDVHATVTVRLVFPIIWGVTRDWSGSGKQVSLMLQRTAISLSIRLRISQWVSWTVSGSLWQAVWCWVRKFALSWQHPTDYRKQLSCALE